MIKNKRNAEAVENSVNCLHATDDYGREVNTVAGLKKDKYAGLFYFLWHGQHPDEMDNIYDITKILKTDPAALWDVEYNETSKVRMFHHWGEPLYGYYNSSDPYVLRKHIELFCYAGIDFLVFDCTNVVTYPKTLEVLLPIMQEYHDNGYNVPKIVFYLNSQSSKVIDTLYRGDGTSENDIMRNGIYKRGLYKDLWFMPDGKPKIAAITKKGNTNAGSDDVRVTDAEILGFFDVWESQWPNNSFHDDGLPWIEWTRPQPLHNDVVNVSIAQHNRLPFSDALLNEQTREEMWGRGYSDRFGQSHDKDAMYSGVNFEEQWDCALKTDARFLFITGWNEWTAIKFIDPYRNVPYFVDTFNLEYSRDIEMMKDGYFDNPYLQMVRNIRRFKGIEEKVKSGGDKTQKIYAGSRGASNRDFKAFAGNESYCDASVKNMIESVSAGQNENNIYFNIDCAGPVNLTPDKNSMNIFIGFDGKDNQFLDFEFVINRSRGEDGTCSVEKIKRTNNILSYEPFCAAQYKISGKTFTLTIPKANIGVQKWRTMYFKIADGSGDEWSKEKFYTQGSCVPTGRFSLVFKLG